MRHLAAYLLLVVGGNTNPTAEDITNVLSQAGIEADSERLSQLLAELEGKDINELVALGKEKLMVGAAMGAAPAAAAAGAAPAAGGAPAAGEKPKEKPKEEEVDALDGGMDMFGGGGGGGDY
jgi:large subunit ribosomal protein LP2